MPWMFSKIYARDSRSEEEAKSVGHVQSSALATRIDTRTFFIVRHGESTDNEGGDRYSGITECLLTAEGLRQANCVGRFLQSEGIQRIICSPMKRAVATARAIQAVTGGELIIDRRLREIDYGEWEGLTRKEVYMKWPKAYDKYKQNPVVNIPPAGENPIRVKERVLAFWQEAQYSPSMHGISRVIVITHNAVARIFLTCLSGWHLERYRERRIDNASVSKVIVDGMGKASIIYENCTEHLIR
jgi:broad specificity phosphatase PhoE